MEEEVLQSREGRKVRSPDSEDWRTRRGSNRSLVQLDPRPRFFRFADMGDYEFWLVPFIEVSERAPAIPLHVLELKGDGNMNMSYKDMPRHKVFKDCVWNLNYRLVGILAFLIHFDPV